VWYVTGPPTCCSNKYACDRCKSKQNARKRLLMQEVPKVLAIQLKRFSYLGFGGSKIGRHVRFPSRLDFHNYLTKNVVRVVCVQGADHPTP
jgi:ubiquitin C-terminal hydrolase